MVGKCRHSGTWIMAGGFIEWCYVCGAIRKLVVESDNGHPDRDFKPARYSVPGSTWVRPTGSKDDNPYDKMKSRFAEQGLKPVGPVHLERV